MRPRDAAGSAKVEETKVNLADGMSFSFFFFSLHGERYPRQTEGGEDVKMEITGEI